MNLESPSGGWETAEFAALRSGHFYKLRHFVPVNQKILSDIPAELETQD